MTCWSCISYRIDRHGKPYCKRGFFAFPKRCYVFEYEPGSDEQEHQHETNEGTTP